MVDTKRKSHLKQCIAYHAARLVIEGSAENHGLALRKAAQRLGAINKKIWPSTAEVDEILKQELRLFRREQPRHLQMLRNLALNAMGIFSCFDPHLVGPVAGGTAELDDAVTIYLFSDTPEEIVYILIEKGIPWEEGERKVRYGNSQRIARPLFSFIAGDIAIELIVLPILDIRSPPLNPLTNRPDRGINIKTLKQLTSDNSKQLV